MGVQLEAWVSTQGGGLSRNKKTVGSEQLQWRASVSQTETHAARKKTNKQTVAAEKPKYVSIGCNAWAVMNEKPHGL